MRFQWCPVVVALAVLVQACPPADRSDAVQERGAAAASISGSDQLLLAAASIALPPPGLSGGDLPEPSSPGAQLVAKYCGQCHALPAPASHAATDWPGVARRMWLRMDGLPPALEVNVPTIPERAALLDYLLANALRVSGATLPPGRGREEFSLVCSRCHALPDPRMHSPGDWPVVFARMERNMERMKSPPLTGTQTTDILVYLQTLAARR